MSLPHAILGLLTYQPMTGYDLKHHFDHSINYFWSAQQSQIYRELAALESKEYVSSHIEPQEGRPDRKVYSITASGERELQGWLERFPQVLTTSYREELMVHIFFASRLPLSELKFQLQRFLRERQEHMAAYEAVDKMISKPSEIPGHLDESFYWRLTLKRGFAQARADIGWAEECIWDIKEKEGLRETGGHERSEEP